MGHRKLHDLDDGMALWTGDQFNYLYLRHEPTGKEYKLPKDTLYDTLREQVRSELIAMAEDCQDWMALVSALQVLRGSSCEEREPFTRSMT